MKKIFFILLALKSFNSTTAQVNLQTGSAVFDLSIFNWQDPTSRLNSLVGLSYNSDNGLLVDEVASNIGQGWNLTAGGVITRLQVGQPDDQKPREGDYNDLKKYPPGYLYNPTAISAGCPQALANYPIFGSQNILYKQHNIVDADRELDYFSFQFNGRQGVFILGKGNGDKGIMLGDSKLKISFDRDEAIPYVRTSITAFNIQDENGLIYKFKDKGLTKVQRSHYCNIDQYGYASATGIPDFSASSIYNESDFDELGMDENPFIVSSWCLTEIDDPLTSRKITFNYNYLNINTSSGKTMTWNKPYDYTTTRYITISYKNTIAQKPVLATISYPDGHQVICNYGAQRMDLIGDKMLKSIRVEYQDRIMSQYDLTQSYFIRNAIGTPSSYTQGQMARLCLLSVKKTGVDLKLAEPPFNFDYNLGSGAPDDFVPPLFFELKDIWGYYNGNNDGVPTDGSLNGYDQYVKVFFHPLPGTLPGNNQNTIINPKPGYAKNGLLKKITYPQGGSIAYDYDQNKMPAGSTIGLYYGGVHVSKTTLNDGISSSNDIIRTYSYVLADGSSSIWGVETPICRVLPTTYFHPESPYVKFGIPPCDYGYKYAGILAQDEAVNLSDLQQFMVVFSQVLGYVGLALDIYALITTLNPVFIIFDILAGIVDCVADSNYLWYHSVDFNYNMLSANTLPVQFKRVEVANGGPGINNGKTVYEYTSPDDFPVIVPDITNTWSAKQRTAFWAYGLLKKTTTYGSDGTTLVKQTENIYDYTKAQTAIDPAHSSSCKCFVLKRSSKGSDTWTSPTYINSFTTQNITNYTSDPAVKDELIVDPYTMYTGHVELQKTYERFYKDNSNYLQKLTQYEYSPNNYQVRKITTTLTNGDKNIKEIYYSSDYTAPAALQSLVSNNITDLPVATYSSVIKNNTSAAAYLGASVTEFSTTTSGDIKPSKSWTGRSSSPGTGYTFDPANPLNYTGLILTQSFSYDPAGNLAGSIDEGGRSVSNLYDYDNTKTVATALNAGAGEIAYSSFETDNGGGWTLNPVSGTDPVYPTTTSLTGSRSLQLQSIVNITTTLSIGKTYTLSFWSDNPSVSVTGGAVLKRSAPTVNGFTYYEYELAAGSASPVISGAGDIDELRLYPKNARMTTTTYDPVLGKTATCDAGNRIAYFEYDFLGRIRLVRDENKNVIKMYEYNYKQPQ